jgi:mono/diheme cytochrome c family protein
MISRVRSVLWMVGLIAGAYLFGALSARSAARAGPDAGAPLQVTYNHDIAPIVYRYCSSCHRPGEAAPFSLLAYSDVKRHARQIADLTRARVMPPWLPEPQEAKFADELRL